MTTAERLRLLLVLGGGPREAQSPAAGSVERALWELATRLPESRYEVSAWLSPEPHLDELAEALEQYEIAVERVEEPPPGVEFKSRLKLWQSLRRSRPGLIHLHVGDRAAWHHLPALARVAGSPPVVISQHGLPGAGPWTWLRSASVVTASCAATVEQLVRDHGLSKRRLLVVPGGADLPDEMLELPAAGKYRERFAPAIFRPLWVSAGRLETPKGHEVFLEALAILVRRGLDFVVAIAGEGSRRSALERLAADRGLSQRVHFLGAIESLGPLLLAANAVVLTSREEALPLSLLEAMARARPVVATGVGGIPELIEDGLHGLLVPPDDPEALARVLSRLHGKQDLSRQMGLCAQEQVRDGFTWGHAADRYEAIYDDVLGLAGFSPAAESGRPGWAARSRA